ncbi:lysosomal thioesterase PPT2-like isoform X2 [Dendronephthya gigantea]|uniref:lysosomal thioesterase PPT2-like isoform X2 n=1 Tax=Dendronephthya gigantea TaxID=151771 RepID=UPI00106D26B6|nr:lysosomal thioesterase PPT2-like isoform X2 [Dendronephthya gigantea]
MSKWLVLVLLFAQYCEVRSYKPVVIIHGILDTAESLNDLKSMIEKAHPGTNVTVIKLYPEIQSLSTPMWVQVNGVSKVLKEIMAKSKDGVHLIGFSQVPSLLAKFLPSVTKEYLYLFLYKKGFQDHLTIANYWNDPKHTKEYLAGNIFLPLVNNNNNSKFADKQKYRLQKENFSKLKNITVISGPQDGVIIPWQSALFGFYDASLNIVPMEKQKAYTEDWFGLGTLAKRKAIHTFMFENITHTSWHGSEVVFNKAIKQWLT